MTQQPDGIRREADLHGVTPQLPPATEATPSPEPIVQLLHFFFLTIGLYLLYPMCLSLVFVVLRDAGYFTWYYDPQFVAEALDPQHPQQAALSRLQMWAVAFAFPFWFTPIVILFAFLPAAYRREIGVSLGTFPRGQSPFTSEQTAARSMGANVLLGVVAWLLLTPVVLGVNLFIGWLYTRYTGIAAKEHPLTMAANSEGMRPLEWGLLGFGVLVSAPVWEELLFRGLLPALARKVRGSGGHALMTLALFATLHVCWKPVAAALDDGYKEQLLAGMPILFVLAMLPFYIVVCCRSRTDHGPVVFSSALLFGVVHSSVWPTPIALFILGLGLASLAVWTRSLLAPIVVHGLFNAVSYVLLALKLFPP